MRTIRLFSILALLFAQSQVICAEDKDLADAEDNTSWITSNNGGTFNVTLSGRTLYKDGDWNTLCLPFNLTKEQIAASPLADATIKELLTTSNLNDGKLTLYFQETTTIEAGKPYIVKWDVITINSDTDWKSFSNKVNAGTSYKGKIVRLGADITVTAATMVGSSSLAFEGTFDGCGHTITCDFASNSLNYAAPFCKINNATIMNVKVTGSVKGGNHCAGLVGYASGTNTINNCEVAAAVTCSGAYCGGVLGHGATSTTEIRDCLFSGSISGATTATGIIYGRSDAGTGTHTIVNCLANGTYSGGTVALMQGNGTYSATNSYMIKDIEERGAALVTKLGSANWTVSGDDVVPTLKAVSHVTNPLFNAVTISSSTNDVTFTGGTFKGNYAPLTISDSNRSEILLLAGSNKLGYAKTGTTPTLNAFRAYFEIPTGTPVRSFQLDFGDDDRQTTGILRVEHPKVSVESYYDLQGRKVTNPTKGLYIIGGRKVIIK